MNMYYKIWMDVSIKNDYNQLKYIGVKWSRDEKRKEQTIRNTSEEQFQQEFECEFLGSVNTLISKLKIKSTHILHRLNQHKC
ncbi:MAG: hypothetical protein CM15mV25_0760 [uncultured marine virus]|nr:MAG: hypothetical protein CM15mV25_0760 [uncultured marine virus]